MTQKATVLAVIAWLTALVGATPVRAAALPPLLQEVEARYAKATTLVAHFSQVNHVAALKQTRTTTGLLMVKRPNKLRWETLKPDPNLLVSDGRTFWFYTPPFEEGERGQLIERKTSEIQSRLANALLSGSFSMARDMKITRLDGSRFSLTPKPRTAGTIRKAEIAIDPATKIIKKVTLAHEGGNRSEITLSNIELGKQLANDLFIFRAPPNTDRVHE